MEPMAAAIRAPRKPLRLICPPKDQFVRNYNRASQIECRPSWRVVVLMTPLSKAATPGICPKLGKVKPLAGSHRGLHRSRFHLPAESSCCSARPFLDTLQEGVARARFQILMVR